MPSERIGAIRRIIPAVFVLMLVAAFFFVARSVAARLLLGRPARRFPTMPYS